VKVFKTIGKWILMFLMLWFVGIILGAVFDLGFALIGKPLSDSILGIIVLVVIIVGLIVYGINRKKSEVIEK
jgi:hypothetical protein